MKSFNFPFVSIVIALTLLLGCENIETPPTEIVEIELTNPSAWTLASTPLSFAESSLLNDVKYGENRALLAWYQIDPLFLRDYNETPNHIKHDLEQREDLRVMEIYGQHLYPEKYPAYGQPVVLQVLNLAYYPTEKGPYNYDYENVNSDGRLLNPEMRWGGIMRPVQHLETIKYIEFWMMNPLTENDISLDNGQLTINFGSISEDILKDNSLFAENGLNPSNTSQNSNNWGRMSSTDSQVNYDDNFSSNRSKQDVGLDGLSNNDEQSFFHSYCQNIAPILYGEAFDKTMADPSSDDYHYYRGSDYDENKTSILGRYKYFNNHDGNSIFTEYSPESYATASTTRPDNEDINGDKTLNTNNNYYEYKIDLAENALVQGNNHIDSVMGVDVQTSSYTLTVKWNHFKIPIQNYDSQIGQLGAIGTENFIRLYLTNIDRDIVLRIVDFKLTQE